MSRKTRPLSSIIYWVSLICSHLAGLDLESLSSHWISSIRPKAKVCGEFPDKGCQWLFQVNGNVKAGGGESGLMCLFTLTLSHVLYNFLSQLPALTYSPTRGCNSTNLP